MSGSLELVDFAGGLVDSVDGQVKFLWKIVDEIQTTEALQEMKLGGGGLK